MLPYAVTIIAVAGLVGRLIYECDPSLPWETEVVALLQENKADVLHTDADLHGEPLLFVASCAVRRQPTGPLGGVDGHPRGSPAGETGRTAGSARRVVRGGQRGEAAPDERVHRAGHLGGG